MFARNFFYSCEEFFYSFEEIFLQLQINFFYSSKKKFFIVSKKFLIQLQRKFFYSFFIVFQSGPYICKKNFLYLREKCFDKSVPEQSMRIKMFFFSFKKSFFIDIRHFYSFSFQLFMTCKNYKKIEKQVLIFSNFLVLWLKIGVNCSNFSF